MNVSASAPSSARTAASFEIKSANLPLVALLLKSTDLAAFARDMAQRFGDIPNFFEQDPLVIDLTHVASRPFDDAAIDFPTLTAVLRQHQLAPVAVKGGNHEQMQAALAAGLTVASEAQLIQSRLPSETPAPDTAPTAVSATAAGALIIDKPLRSGQQVYARGRDLVVLAIVNAGAEVIADGSIHVYAPLRGKAIAGARGNTEARIFSLALDAELLSIAGVYRTSESPLPAGLLGKPAQIRLVADADGDKLLMEPLTG